MCCVQLMDKLCCVEVTQRLGIEGYNHCAVTMCVEMVWSCFVRRNEYDWVKDVLTWNCKQLKLLHFILDTLGIPISLDTLDFY